MSEEEFDDWTHNLIKIMDNSTTNGGNDDN